MRPGRGTPTGVSGRSSSPLCCRRRGGGRAGRELAYITAAGNRIPAAGTTAGDGGTPEIEARSAAWLTLARLGLDPAAAGLTFPPPRAWAAPDPRSPLAGILAAIGERATATAAVICQHAEKVLADLPPPPAAPVQDQAASAGQRPRAGGDRRRTRPAPSPPIPGPPGRSRISSWSRSTWRPRSSTGRACRLLGGRIPGRPRLRAGIAAAGTSATPRRMDRAGDHLQAAGFGATSSRGRAGPPLPPHRPADRLFRDRIIIPLRGPHGQVTGSPAGPATVRRPARRSTSTPPGPPSTTRGACSSAWPRRAAAWTAAPARCSSKATGRDRGHRSRRRGGWPGWRRAGPR